jgi:hypothetical protein
MLEHGFGPGPGLFSQFLVDNLSALPKLLTKVETTAQNALRESKQFVFAESK